MTLKKITISLSIKSESLDKLKILVTTHKNCIVQQKKSNVDQEDARQVL